MSRGRVFVPAVVVMLAAFIAPAPLDAAEPSSVAAPAAGEASRPPGSYQHKRLFGFPLSHSPVEEGPCSDCHDMHFPPAEPRLSAPPAKLCTECHDPFRGRTVHKPVAQGRCGSCHLPHGSRESHLLTTLGAPLCTGCHKDKLGGTHRQGVMEGGCQTCHDPHATESKRLLRGGMGGAQCLICHGKTVKGKVVHSPLLERSCGDCHDPHLNPPRPTVPCRQCHSAVLAGKFVHEPVKEGCDACHASHSGANPSLLLSPLPALCLDCHEEKKGGKHGKKTFPDPCIRCHSPHGSDARGMIRGGIDPAGCPQCHEDLMTGKKHRHTPADNGDCADCHNPHANPPRPLTPCTECHDTLMRGRYKHEPAEESCGNCHDNHASANRSQLTAPLPRLCLDCHEEMKGGRHGRIRLGEDCTRCHDPHSAGQPKVLSFAIASTPCSSCHGFMKEGKVVHKPVAADDCGGCHNPHAAPPLETVPCTACHEQILDAPFQHAPAASSCLKCHFAHSGPERALLTDEPPALCVSCHPRNAEGRHGRWQMSTDCLQCHQPHAGGNPGLVKNMETRRCESCHPGKRAGKHVHSALERYQCKDCHNPHSDPREMPPLSCLQCHQDISDRRPGHGSAVKERCLECHDPHSSNTALMVKPVTDTSNLSCLSCHSRIRRGMEKGQSVHRPILDGSCLQCHTNHAGTPPYTNRAMSTELITPYATSAYDLCFSCHESDPVEIEFTETDTRFRDGVRNLHYLHVVRDRIKGYACWACHDSHAAYQKMLVNDAPPYQPKYQLKIEFNLVEKGGSCVTNCHPFEEYRR